MRRHWLLILIILLIICSVLIDKFNYYFIGIKGFDEIVSYVLQIQATISALGIALLSFITNRSDEEYYGISVTRFSFKQLGSPLSSRNCVIIVLLLIPTSIGFYCLGFYNSVVTIFLVSLLLILRIFNNVSVSFKSKKDIRSILFQSVLRKVLSDERTITDYFDSFKAVIINQSIDIIDEYVEKTKTIYDLLLQSDEKKNYRLFCQKLGLTCDYLLKANSQSKIERGVKLLIDIFMKYRDSEKTCIKNDPDIINQCQISISEVFEKTDDTSIRFDLCCHLPYIIFGAEITDERIGPDAKPWYSLGKAFGFYVGKNNDLPIMKRMVPSIDDSFWFGNHKYKQEIIRVLTNYKTGFAISIFNCGKANQSFDDYVVKMTNRIVRDENSFIGYVLTLIIYCLYICIYETQVPIQEATKQTCRLFLSRVWEQTKELIKNAIYSNRFSLKEYEEQFAKILRQEELFKEDEAKFMVMDHAIRESFIIIFAICIGIEPYFNSLVEEYVGEDGFSFYSIVEDKKRTLKTIKTILEIFRDDSYLNSTVDVYDTHIENLYSKIKTAIESAFKNGEIKHAIDLEKDLGNIEEYDKQICQQLEKEISEQTTGIKREITAEEESDSDTNPILFRFSVPLLFYQNDNYYQTIHSCSESLIGMVFKQVESIAQKMTINPNTSEDMERFFCLLESYDTVVGSEPLIRSENRSIEEMYQRFISTKKTLFVSVYPGKMVLLDSLSSFFRFKDFSVKSRKLSNEEILRLKNVVKRDDSQYSVNITNDIRLSFSEEELVKYYSAYMRMMHFSCTEQFKFSRAVIVQFTR